MSRSLSRWSLVAPIVGLALAGCNDNRADADDTGVVEPDGSGEGDVGVDAAADTASDTPITLDVPIFTCDDEDDLSPNHDEATATRVDGGLSRDDLFLCPDADDWFVVSAPADRAIVATISFSHGVGDLDLYLLAPGTTDLDNALAVSGTEEDTEVVRYVPSEAGDYLVYVDGFRDEGGPYSIDIRVRCASDAECNEGQRCSLVDGACIDDLEPICGLDDGEPNDRLDEAEPLGISTGETRIANRRVCEEDDDYFVVELPETSHVRVTLSHDVGEDLELSLYDAGGLLEARGVPLTDNAAIEVMNARYVAAGTHYLAVNDLIAGLGLDVGYDLDVEITAASCSTNTDCGSTPGRQVCEDGACVSFVPAEPGGPGAPCDDPTDCERGLFCYGGTDGFDDNLCTRECNGAGQCDDFEDGYCLDLFRFAVCTDGCSSDAECPSVYACDEAQARCVLIPCGVDADCEGDAICRRSEQQGGGFCTENVLPACDVTDAYEPNGSDATATPIPAGGIRDATICDGDDDWYVLEVAESGTRLDVEVDFERGVDIDVFVYDARGRTVGQGSEPEAVPEIAAARYLAAGTYWVRVNQFPGTGDVLTTYSLTVRERPDRCTVEGAECLVLQPIRPLCDEGSGACAFIDGNGEVEPGGACDSDNDCAEPAEFCWTFESATEGRNICTRGCERESDCDEFTGTTCTRVGRGFSACLPG